MSEVPSRVMAIWCPDWPVTATGVDAAVPAAVVDRGQVEACSSAAREAGVRRGQRLRDAQRHCPSLVVRPRDQAGEARVFEPVVEALERLCPRVEILRPGMCAFPSRGPTRYWSGEETLAGMIRDAVAGLGYACGVGAADGLFAAVLAARAGEGGTIVEPGGAPSFLAPHPVAVLAPAVVNPAVRDRPDLGALLVRLGIRTLGAFAALPVEDVGARFGVWGVRAHRLAGGRESRPPAPRRPPPELAASLEFEPPVEHGDRVVFAAKSLADRLHANLAAEGLACVRVEVRVEWADGRALTRLWRHDGLLSSLAVAERVRWQLDAVGPRKGGGHEGGGHEGGGHEGGGHEYGDGGDPAGEDPAGEDPIGGVVSLRLIPDQVVVDEGRQLPLWGETVAGDLVGRAAERVQAMLGLAAVRRGVSAGGRGPGERVILVPWGDVREVRRPADAPWPGRIPPPAPALVHPEPPRARVADAAGRPVAVSGRCAVSAPLAELAVDGEPVLAITGWAGPWPSLEWWWDQAQARRLVRFQTVTADGRAWLLLLERGQWRVEATYA